MILRYKLPLSFSKFAKKFYFILNYLFFKIKNLLHKTLQLKQFLFSNKTSFYIKTVYFNLKTFKNAWKIFTSKFKYTIEIVFQLCLSIILSYNEFVFFYLQFWFGAVISLFIWFVTQPTNIVVCQTCPVFCFKWKIVFSFSFLY